METNFNKLIIKTINKKKIFCCNCGKYGHKYSKCIEPITSLGVIAIKVTDDDEFLKFNDFFNNDNNIFNLIKTNTINNNILLKIKSFENKLKFLMIRRKKTLGFIEFIRGRYNEKKIDEYLYLFEQMTHLELEEIRKNNFEKLWNSLWNNCDNKYFKHEFEESLRKYNYIKSSIKFDTFLDNIKIRFDTPEWGFPKGRRLYLEKNIDCACREFEEETSLSKDDYVIINNIPPINEVFYGTNNILYKHIYYFALCKSDISVKLDKDNVIQNDEIGDINFFNYTNAYNVIRNYHNERQNILNESYIFFSSIINNRFNYDKISTSINNNIKIANYSEYILAQE